MRSTPRAPKQIEAPRPPATVRYLPKAKRETP